MVLENFTALGTALLSCDLQTTPTVMKYLSGCGYLLWMSLRPKLLPVVLVTHFLEVGGVTKSIGVNNLGREGVTRLLIKDPLRRGHRTLFETHCGLVYMA